MIILDHPFFYLIFLFISVCPFPSLYYTAMCNVVFSFFSGFLFACNSNSFMRFRLMRARSRPRAPGCFIAVNHRHSSLQFFFSFTLSATLTTLALDACVALLLLILPPSQYLTVTLDFFLSSLPPSYVACSVTCRTNTIRK